MGGTANFTPNCEIIGVWIELVKGCPIEFLLGYLLIFSKLTEFLVHLSLLLGCLPKSVGRIACDTLAPLGMGGKVVLVHFTKVLVAH